MSTEEVTRLHPLHHTIAILDHLLPLDHSISIMLFARLQEPETFGLLCPTLTKLTMQLFPSLLLQLFAQTELEDGIAHLFPFLTRDLSTSSFLILDPLLTFPMLSITSTSISLPTTLLEILLSLLVALPEVVTSIIEEMDSQRMIPLVDMNLHMSITVTLTCTLSSNSITLFPEECFSDYLATPLLDATSPFLRTCLLLLRLPRHL